MTKLTRFQYGPDQLPTPHPLDGSPSKKLKTPELVPGGGIILTSQGKSAKFGPMMELFVHILGENSDYAFDPDFRVDIIGGAPQKVINYVSLLDLGDTLYDDRELSDHPLIVGMRATGIEVEEIDELITVASVELALENEVSRRVFWGHDVLKVNMEDPMPYVEPTRFGWHLIGDNFTVID